MMRHRRDAHDHQKNGQLLDDALITCIDSSSGMNASSALPDYVRGHGPLANSLRCSREHEMPLVLRSHTCSDRLRQCSCMSSMVGGVLPG